MQCVMLAIILLLSIAIFSLFCLLLFCDELYSALMPDLGLNAPYGRVYILFPWLGNGFECFIPTLGIEDSETLSYSNILQEDPNIRTK